MRAPLSLFTALSLALLIAACGGDDKKADTATTATTPVAAATTETTPEPAASTSGCKKAKPTDGTDRKPAKPTKADALPKDAKASVTLVTSCGTITIALDTKAQNKTASSFAKLVKGGFYDGLTFHRISGQPGQDFVIQGGDPEGTGMGGPGWSIQEDPPADAQYTRGVVAMAKTGAEPAGTSGSQFFIVTATDSGLPADYAIVGKVTGGDQAVTTISQVEKDGNEVPLEPVVIEKATLSVKK